MQEFFLGGGEEGAWRGDTYTPFCPVSPLNFEKVLQVTILRYAVVPNADDVQIKRV